MADRRNDVNTHSPIRIAVIGAGLVGQRHARLAVDHPRFSLVAIVDTDQRRQTLADELGCRLVETIDDLDASDCEAAIVATPNSNHLTAGLKCLERSWPCLIEKPLSDTIADGEKLEAAFFGKGIPLLVGHHRRYHPFVEQAREIVSRRQLGDPVAASIIWAVRKSDSYFQQGAWRLGADGGPLQINLIHELDLMLHILGPVAEVQAVSSHHQRGNPVEDTAAILLRFASGMLATVTISDAAHTPWSFEGGSGENPGIAETGIASWRVGCTGGAFEFPPLRIWQHGGQGAGDWSKPLQEFPAEHGRVDPLEAQLTHFAKLVRQECAQPVVSGRDGLAAMRLLASIIQATEKGAPVTLPVLQSDLAVAKTGG